MTAHDFDEWERQDDLPLILIHSSIDQRGLVYRLAEAICEAPGLTAAAVLYRLARELGVDVEVSGAVTRRLQVAGKKGRVA